MDRFTYMQSVYSRLAGYEDLNDAVWFLSWVRGRMGRTRHESFLLIKGVEHGGYQ